MPTWLSDPSNGFYLVLFVLAVITVMLWARSRTRGDLIRVGIAIALLVAVFVFDRLFESPREGAAQTVSEISAAFNERNWDKFQDCLSDDFSYKKLDRKTITDRARGAATAFDPQTSASEFKAPDDMQPNGPNEFLLQFDGLAHTQNSRLPAHFVGTFVKGQDGKWRLKTFTAYDFVQKRQPIDIPGVRD